MGEILMCLICLIGGVLDNVEVSLPFINNDILAYDSASYGENVSQSTEILISALGDCTIGSDPSFGVNNSFHTVFSRQGCDYTYFFGGVYDILSNDDLTIANLETTFTDATKRRVKEYNFKGPAEYANILTAGSVEAVNIANNHIMDYLEVGYEDTKKALDDVGIPYFGQDISYIYEIKGLRVGLLGFKYSTENLREKIVLGIQNFKDNNVDLIIVSFHWGIERNYKQNSNQQELGRYAIDAGADLVLGHHPHVIQGIEKYNDKYIVYSLANFVFGGNANPPDKDTFIFQQKFEFLDGDIISTDINIIPVSVSSVSNCNDYRPTILLGNERLRVLNKILKYSINIDYIADKTF